VLGFAVTNGRTSLTIFGLCALKLSNALDNPSFIQTE
jgi:hypothetical protein